jgi:hypothetical protein
MICVTKSRNVAEWRLCKRHAALVGIAGPHMCYVNGEATGDKTLGSPGITFIKFYALPIPQLPPTTDLQYPPTPNPPSTPHIPTIPLPKVSNNDTPTQLYTPCTPHQLTTPGLFTGGPFPEELATALNLAFKTHANSSSGLFGDGAFQQPKTPSSREKGKKVRKDKDYSYKFRGLRRDSLGPIPSPPLTRATKKQQEKVQEMVRKYLDRIKEEEEEDQLFLDLYGPE